MDSSHTLIPILNALPFIDVVRLSSVNRSIYNMSKSEDYWQQRAKGILPCFQSYLDVSFTNPRLKYAWAVVESKVVLKDPSVTIFLYEDSKLIFPGLEKVIGLELFIKRSISQNNADLMNYGFSLGPSRTQIDNILAFAVETSSFKPPKYGYYWGVSIDKECAYVQARAKLAYDLSVRFENHREYNTRFHPEPRGLPESTFRLAKYGHFYYAASNTGCEQCSLPLASNWDYWKDKFVVKQVHDPDGDVRKLISYLNGLLRGGHLDQSFDLLNKHPRIAKEVKNIEHVAAFGSLGLIDLYLQLSGDLIETRRAMVKSLVETNRVDIVKKMISRRSFRHLHRLDRIKVDRIKSMKMYVVIRRNPNIFSQSLTSAVIIGGSFRLIFDFIDKMDIKIDISQIQSPLVREILVSKYGLGMILIFPIDVTAYEYNLYRSVGMPKQEQLRDAVLRYRNELNFDFLPFVKYDFIKKA